MSHNIWTRWVARLFQQKLRSRAPRQRLNFESLEDRVVPTTDVWQGISAKWSVAANWSAGVPKAGYDLVFSSPTAFKATTDDVLLGAGTAFNSITFSAGGYSISGALAAQLPVSGNFNVGANLVGTEKINVATELLPPTTNPSQTFAIGAGSTLDIAGQLTGNPVAANAAKQTLLKTLAGTLQLDGNNATWTGAVTLNNNGGIVAITNANALGTGAVVAGVPTAGVTTVGSNAQLQVIGGASGLNPINEQLILNGPGINNDGAILNVSGINVWAGPVALAPGPSPVFLGSNAGDLFIQGQISDQGAGQSVTKVGNAIVTFSHVGGDTYRGQTVVNNGILAIQDPLSLGAGANALSPLSGKAAAQTIVNYNSVTGLAGTLELDYNPGPATAANPSPTAIPSNDPNAILQNPLLPFNAATNPIVGFQVFNDLITLNGPGFDPYSPQVYPFTDPATGITYPTIFSNAIGAFYNLNGNNDWDGNVILGSAAPSTDDVYIGSAGTTAANPNTNLTIDGLVSDPARQPVLHKTGLGRVILTDANTYTAGTEIDEGTVQIRDSSALGAGQVVVENPQFFPLNVSALELGVDSGLDGTPLRTHNRNLGFDSITQSGQGLIPSTVPPTFAPPAAGDLGAGNSYDKNTGHFLGFDGTNTDAAADSFTVSSTVTLQTLSMALGYFGAGPNNGVKVTIHSGSPSGPLIDTLNFDTASGATIQPFGASGNSPVTVYSATKPTLNVGTTYWIDAQAITPAKDFYGWNFNNVGLSQLHGFSLDNGATWDATIPDTVGAFSVNSIFPPTPGSVQEVYVPGSSGVATGGSFTLSFEGQSTGALANNVSAANLQILLNTLPTIAAVGGVTVTQDADVYRVAFGNTTNIPLMTITTSIAGSAVNPVYGLRVSNTLIESGYGVNQGGALLNVSGINNYLGTITMGVPLTTTLIPNYPSTNVTFNPIGSIGVDSDARPGHPTADNSYGTYDYRLTLPATDTLNSPANTVPNDELNPYTTLVPPQVYTTFVKEDKGQLVLPAPNTTLIGGTDIEGGWITAQANDALGLPISVPALNSTVQPDSITVAAGASLQLDPAAGTNITLGNNLLLSGSGISHPFSMLTEGALVSLSGTNVVTGNVQLDHNAGIGVDDPITTDPPGASTLTTTGQISDYVAKSLFVQGFVPVLIPGEGGNGTDDSDQYPFTLTGYSADGGALEQRFLINTGATAGTVTINFDFYGTGLGINAPDTLNVYDPSKAMGGSLIYSLPAAMRTGPQSITFAYSGTSKYLELVVNEGGQPPVPDLVPVPYSPEDGLGDVEIPLNTPFSAWTILGIGVVPNVPPSAGGITKLGSQQLTMDGPGTYTGAVNVQAGTLLVQNDTALGLNTSGTSLTASPTPSNDTYFNTTTTVASGALLELGQGLATNNGGIATGVQISNEHLVLNSPGQQVSVSGSAGTFTLAFGAATTGALAYNVPASGGVGPTASLQNALNALSTIGGVGGSVTVTQSGNTYTVVFGGTLAGINNPLLVAATPGNPPGNLTLTVSGSNFPIYALFDNMWSGPVTLGTNTTVEVAPNARLTLAGTIDDATNPVKSGSTLTVNEQGSNVVTGTPDTGELVLSGSNTYRGTTVAQQGILTIANSQALGTPGGAEVQTIAVGGLSGTFAVTFQGYTTGALAFNVPAAGGVGPTASLQNALDALTSIGGVGGSVTVTKVGTVYTVTFDGGSLAGAAQPLMTAAGTAITTGTPVVETQVGYGGTIIDNGSQMQIVGNLTVAGESLQFQGTGVGTTPNTVPVLRWFAKGPAPTDEAQTAGSNAATGRVTGVAVNPTDSAVIYVSSAGGGAWRTINDGLTWTPLFDNNAAMFSGAIAIDPNEPNDIYLGTGEADNSGDSYYGTGVYGSTDDGQTWTLLTNPDGTNPLAGASISRIVVDPGNPGIFYAAASDQPVNDNNPAPPFGPSNAGVWKFTPGAGWLDLTGITSDLRAFGVSPAPPANPDTAVEGILNLTTDLGLPLLSPGPGFGNYWGGPGMPGFPPPPVNDPISVSGFPTGTAPTPGPDDNWNVTFPTTGTYSDLSFGLSTFPVLVYNFNLNPTQWVVQQSPPEPTLYVAAGTPGDPNGTNAVYRIYDPAAATDGTNTVWDIGDGNTWAISTPSGTPPTQTLTVTYDTGNPKGNGTTPGSFPLTGQFNPLIPDPANSTIKISASGTTVYAAVTSFLTGGLDYFYVSPDGGHTWAETASQPSNYLGQQGDYDSTVAASPTNPSTVFVGGVETDPVTHVGHVLMSIDGGTTWTDVSVDGNGNGPRTDDHAMMFDYLGRLIVGSDGGVWRYDPNALAGLSSGAWTDLNGNLASTLETGVATAPGNPNTILATSQDGETELTTGTSPAWTNVNSGSTAPSALAIPSAGNPGRGSGEVKFDPQNPSIAYSVTDGVLNKSTNGGLTWTPVLGVTFANGYAPLAVDVINPFRLLVGGFSLQESLDQGASWTNLLSAIPVPGPDLGDPLVLTSLAAATYQGESGPNGTYLADKSFPLVADKGADTYDPDTIYATVIDQISGDQFLLVSMDHGQSWADRTPKTATGTFMDLVVDPRNRNNLFAVAQGVPGSGGSNEVLYSTDAGQTWKSIVTDVVAGKTVYDQGLPDVPFWTATIDPRSGTLYLGTDEGVYSTTPDATGAYTNGWTQFGQGLPLVQVTSIDLDLQTNSLTVATYGRSVYQFSLDNVTANSGAIRVVAGASIWTGPVRLTGPSTVQVDGTQTFPQGMASLDIQGTVSDLNPATGANDTLTKVSAANTIGQGTLILSGANTYLGATDVQAGVIQANNLTALGSTTAGTTVEQGAALYLSANLDAEPVILNGDGFSFNSHYTGALRNISGDNTFSGTVNLASGTNSTVTIGAFSGTAATLTGVVSGAAGIELIKEETGIIALAGANTYPGNTAVYQGALQVENNTALGTGTATVLDGAQMQIQSGPSGAVTIATPLTLSGTGIFGTGALLDTDVAAGVNEVWNAPITFQTLPGFSAPTTPAGVVAIGVENFGDTLTLADAIGETGLEPTGLLKVLAGNLALQGVDVYTGTTEVSAGTLTVQNPSALGNRFSGSPGLNAVQQIVTLDSDNPNTPAPAGATFTVTFNGVSQTFKYGATANTVQTQLNLLASINGLGSVTVTRTAVQTTNQNGPVTATVKFNPGYLYTIVFSGGLAQTNIPFLVTSLGGVTAGTSFVAAGGTDVLVDSGATLALDNSVNPLTPLDAHQLDLNGTGMPDASGHPEGALYNAVGNNTWNANGNIILDVNSSVGAAAGTTLTIPGTVTANGNTLTKVEPGTVDVTGIALGQTLVASGTLDVEGTVGTVGGVVLQDDGTSATSPATLIGTGTVGVISSGASSGGTIQPGNSATPDSILNNSGIASVVGTQDVLNAHDTFLANISGTNGFSNELGVTNASIDLGGATLDGIIGGGISIGNAYTIIQTDGGSDLVTGTFAGVVAPTDPGANATTVAWIQNEKFLVDYFDDSVTLTRVLAQASMTLAPSLTAPTYGQDEKFVATLTGEVGAPPVTGNVVFTVVGPSGTNNYTIAINPATGLATLDLASLLGSAMALGKYTVTASFNGDNSFGVATFNPIPTTAMTPSPFVTVTASGTTTGLAIAPANPIYGQAIALTATVTSTATSLVSPTSKISAPAGTVTFYDGAIAPGDVLGTLTLPIGTGTTSTVTFLSTSLPLPLGAGSHTYFAVYNGDGIPANYTGSSASKGAAQTIAQDKTTLNLNISVPPPAPAVTGEANVTYTATISGVGFAATSGFPTGTVTFTIGNLLPITVNVSTTGGITTATFTTAAGQLVAGVNQIISASYGGDNNFVGSSFTTTQTVAQATTTTTLQSSQTPSAFGQPVTFTANVFANAPGNGTPTGLVNFYLGSVAPANLLGTGLLATSAVGTTATYTTSPFQFGVGANQTVIAVYQGDANFLGGVLHDGTTLQTVNKAQTSATVSFSPMSPTPVYGQPVTLSALIAVASPGGTSLSGIGKMTGTVNFYLGAPILANLLGSGIVGTVGSTFQAFYTTTINPSQLPAGVNQTITAVYSGDGNFAGASGANNNVTVAQDQTTTTLKTSTANSVAPQTVTFTAVVGANLPGSGNPTGLVTFQDGTLTLGQGSLSTNASGVTSATYTTTANQLPVGLNQKITATYVGDNNFLSSSGATTESVTDGTTTTVTSLPSSTVFGQVAVLTATIVPAQLPVGLNPSGTVTFKLGNTILGTATPSTSGGATTATYTTTAQQLPVGANQAITAIYSGDSTFVGGSGTTTQNVAQDSTTTVLSTSNPTVQLGIGQATLTAQVTSNAPGSGTPTGTVTFTDTTTNTVLGTGTLTGGTASVQATFQSSAGTHVVIAVYNGDGNYATSNSNAIDENAIASGTRTSTATVVSSANPAVLGVAVKFTATIKDTGAGTKQTPTGSVSFFDGTTPIGSGTLIGSAGVATATFSTSSLALGTHSITAVYNGSTTFATATSPVLSQTVQNPIRTSNTTLATSGSPSTYGTAVTFTATVKDGGSGATQTPTGTVTFTDVTTNTVLGTATLSSTLLGTATAVFTTGGATLGAGSHTITAVYNGNASFGPGNAASLIQVVKPVASTTTLKSSVTTATVYGQPVTLTATIKLLSGSGVPTGTVTFYQNGTQIGSAVPVTTTAGVTTAVLKTNGGLAALAVGTDAVTAVYNGDTNVLTSTSNTVTETVKKASTNMALAVVTTDTTVTFTVTVTPVSPSTGHPTGTVTFSVGGVVVGVGTVDPSTGKATVTYQGTFPVGTHTLVAVYSGDADFLGNSKSFTFAGGRGT